MSRFFHVMRLCVAILPCLTLAACLCGKPHSDEGHTPDSHIVLPLPPDLLYVPSLVAIMVADTTDHAAEPGRTIAPGVRANLRNMHDFAKMVADKTQLRYQETVIQGDDTAAIDPFNCEAIEHSLRSVTAGPDDTVLIYYTGHGFNVDRQIEKILLPSIVVPEDAALGAWKTPYMYCGQYGGTKFGKNAAAHNANEADAVRWAKATGARLVIAIFDSCNSYLQMARPAGAAPPRHGAPAPSQQDLYLASLFRSARGSVVLAGSSPGSYGLYFTNGGQFTNQFLAVIDSRVPGRAVSWDAVLPAVLKPMRTRFEQQPYTQQPIAQWQDAAGDWSCAAGPARSAWQTPCTDPHP